MKINIATVRNVKNNKLLLEGYRNRRVDGAWKKEYASACIKDQGLPSTYYVGACIDLVWDQEGKCFKEK